MVCGDLETDAIVVFQDFDLAAGAGRVEIQCLAASARCITLSLWRMVSISLRSTISLLRRRIGRTASSVAGSVIRNFPNVFQWRRIVRGDSGGWVDVVQDGRTSKPTAFSGATDCEGLRKLVRYELAAGELLLQISGVSADTITLAILPAD